MKKLTVCVSRREAHWIETAAELAGCAVHKDDCTNGNTYMKIKEYKHGDLPAILKRTIKDELNPLSYEFYKASRGSERFPAVRILVCAI